MLLDKSSNYSWFDTNERQIQQKLQKRFTL